MSRSINEVKLVFLSIRTPIPCCDRMCFDRNAALTLQVHGIQILRTGFTWRYGAGDLQKPVGKSGFAVVDMSNNGKIADVGLRKGFTHSK